MRFMCYDLGLINWCINEMKISPSGENMLLFCHCIKNSIYSLKALHSNLPTLTVDVLKWYVYITLSFMCLSFEAGWLDVSGLGWFLHLLRWSLANVCDFPETREQVTAAFLTYAGVIFKLSSKFREPGGGGQSFSTHPAPRVDVLAKNSPALTQAVSY